MVWLRPLFLILLLCAQSALPATATTPGDDIPAPRIGIATMSPGTDYWARFGHDAIVVEDPSSGLTLSYNYGYFDFEQPDFLLRFLRGRMLYRLVVMPLADDLAIYAGEGRGVELQWLDLRPQQARALRDFLAWNARPENADYHYDYFTANCSTQVRDALDRVLDGGLSRQITGPSHGLSWRSEALRLGAGVPWLYLGMHVALGPNADRPLSIRDEAFVPQRLADALERARNSDGAPLVAARVRLLPDRLQLERAEPPQWRSAFFASGVGIGALLLFLLRRRAGSIARLAGATLASGFWLLCGLGGLVLAALWGLTEHVASYGNENLLLLDPLALVLLAAVPHLARSDVPPAWLRRLAHLVLAGVAFALFLRFLPFRFQDNGDFIALFGPIHAALAWRLARAAA